MGTLDQVVVIRVVAVHEEPSLDEFGEVVGEIHRVRGPALVEAAIDQGKGLHAFSDALQPPPRSPRRPLTCRYSPPLPTDVRRHDQTRRRPESRFLPYVAGQYRERLEQLATEIRNTIGRRLQSLGSSDC